MIVKVIPYQAEWDDLYLKEAELIQNILSSQLVNIYHIGSTAVHGLKAKPIIDIMPVVKDITIVDNFDTEFEAIGYECMGEFGIKGRLYFRKGGDNRTHQLHIFEESNNTDIKRHLAVRDYLRVHPKEAFEYGELKSKLAELFPNDIEEYSNGKEQYVQQLEQKALSWMRKNIE